MKAIHLQRGASPLDGTAGWCWRIHARNGQTGNGWHAGTRAGAQRVARGALMRLESMAGNSHVLYGRGIRSVEEGLVKAWRGRT